MADIRKKFSGIYDKYVEKIYRFIFLKVNSQEVAEDLTSEVFLRGWETFKNPGKVENIQAFLYQIARNLVVDHYRERGQARLVSTEFLSMVDPQNDLEHNAIVNSDFSQVKRALANLKSDYQEVIVWHYLDELSIPEIAGILDKSEGAIRVTLHRALEELRKLLR